MTQYGSDEKLAGVRVASLKEEGKHLCRGEFLYKFFLFCCSAQVLPQRRDVLTEQYWLLTLLVFAPEQGSMSNRIFKINVPGIGVCEACSLIFNQLPVTIILPKGTRVEQKEFLKIWIQEYTQSLVSTGAWDTPATENEVNQILNEVFGKLRGSGKG
ncbi:hypothetical protein [Komarekiella delphini-convector]|uniref:hypothetical protein n=1 Tax=Komarekiella delphini-convector TaxID=3050158 RepID=UPI00177E0D3B|nr:hypothetical protein [Komarekiella delphini-convector]